MPIVRRTPEFNVWLRELGDKRAKAKAISRIERLELGNPGDVAPIGGGISEMRIHYGPGYRLYFRQHGDTATFLWGGIKDTQTMDIAKAKALAGKWGD